MLSRSHTTVIENSPVSEGMDFLGGTLWSLPSWTASSSTTLVSDFLCLTQIGNIEEFRSDYRGSVAARSPLLPLNKGKLWLVLDEQFLEIYPYQKSALSLVSISLTSIVKITWKLGNDRLGRRIYVVHIATKMGPVEICGRRERTMGLWMRQLELALARSAKLVVDGRCKRTYFLNRVVKAGQLTLSGTRRMHAAIEGPSLTFYADSDHFLCDVAIMRVNLLTSHLVENREAKHTGFNLILASMDELQLSTDDPLTHEAWLVALRMRKVELIWDGGQATPSVRARLFAQDLGNRQCADCKVGFPQMAHLQLCISLCVRCAEVHRVNLGGCLLRLDAHTPEWTDHQLTVDALLAVGNTRSNQFWLAKMEAVAWKQWSQKLLDSSYEDDDSKDITVRSRHIIAKYRHRTYADVPQSSGKILHLQSSFMEAMGDGDLSTALRLLYSGANIRVVDPYSGKTALRQARDSGQNVAERLISLCLDAPNYLGSAPVVNGALGSLVRWKGTATVCFEGENEQTPANPRWNILDYGILYSYLSEASIGDVDNASADLKVIYCEDIVAVGNGANDNELFVAARGDDRKWTLYLADRRERDTWKWSLTASFWPHNWFTYLSDGPELAGLIYLHSVDDDDDVNGESGGGTVDEWLLVWAYVQSRTFYIFNPDTHRLRQYDLRKATRISAMKRRPVEGRGEEEEEGMLTNRTCKLEWEENEDVVEMFAALQHCNEDWLNALLLNFNKSGDNIVDQVYASNNIPLLINKLLLYLEATALDVQGIYRVSGNAEATRQLLDRLLESPRQVDLEREQPDVHVAACVLKQFFQQCLAEPLLSTVQRRHPDLLVGVGLARTPEQRREGYIRVLKSDLVREGYEVLRRLIRHLALLLDHSEQNRWTAKGLATIFGAILLTYQLNGVSIHANVQIVEHLIDDCDHIFATDDEQAVDY